MGSSHTFFERPAQAGWLVSTCIIPPEAKQADILRLFCSQIALEFTYYSCEQIKR
jgi:hypothetical protein